MRTSTLVGLSMVVLACGGGGGARGPARTVTGSCVHTYWLDSGAVVEQPDCRGAQLRTYGADASGQWQHVGSASMTATGFSIDAPTGTYLLGVNYAGRSYWQFYETPSDDLPLGEFWVGRPDVAWPSASTPATFAVDGLSPWSPSDLLELTSSGGHTFRVLARPGDGSVAPDATAATVTFDWNGSDCALPDGSRGDVVWLHQAAIRTAAGAGIHYQTALRAAQLPSTFVMESGVANRIDVRLADVPQTGSVTLDWRLSAFEQYRSDIHPSAVPGSHQFMVDAIPGSLVDLPHLSGGTPDMLWLALPPGSGDQRLDTLSYGQFLPTTWAEFAETYFVAGLSLTAPGATSAATLGASIGRSDPLPLVAPVGPVLSPPRAPQVDGLDAFTGVPKVSTTPLVSWSAPALGTAAYYRLQLVQLVAAPTGETTFRTVAFLDTAATGLRIPPDVLEPGVQYAAILTAWAVSPAVLARGPYHDASPEAWGSALIVFST